MFLLRLRLLSGGALGRPWAAPCLIFIIFNFESFFMGDLAPAANSTTKSTTNREGEREGDRGWIFFLRLLSGGVLGRPWAAPCLIFNFESVFLWAI